MSTNKNYNFTAIINIIGINPFVFVPKNILKKIFKQANKDKGPIPVCGMLNNAPYKQTLMKYKGEWRLYINTFMLKNSPERIGEKVKLTIAFDPVSRLIKPPQALVEALKVNQKAKQVFDQLTPSRQKEIMRYLNNLKTEEALQKNTTRAVQFLLGKARFVGRAKP